MDNTIADDKRQSLTVEENNCVTLSPESKALGHVFKQYRPRTIAEVQELIGIKLPEAAIPAVGSVSCRAPALATGFVAPDAVMAEDPDIRHRARALAYLAAREFVHGRTVGLEHWRDTLDSFVRGTIAVVNVALLWDIDVENGATLTIAGNVHGLHVRDIRLHGTGRIACLGPVTIRAASIVGRIPVFPVPIVSVEAGTLGRQTQRRSGAGRSR